MQPLRRKHLLIWLLILIGVALVVSLSILLTPKTPTTWFVRADGGTRYSANVTTGQCDGKADVSYASTGGTGTNQHCAFNDVRYLWDDFSRAVGQGAWVIAGGDTVVIRGCHALPSQLNASNPNCRIGWDDNSTGNPPNSWCYGVGSYTCYNPPIPAGTSSQHTKILGGCAYGTYSCTPIDNGYPYGTTNETQIFGGMALQATINMQSTQYVDIEGIELTTHNGVCVTQGVPGWPRGCNTGGPVDDFARNGFLTNSASANLLFQDVYVHGMESSAFWGPIGPGIVLTRVNMSFNASDAWDFDDGNDTADGAGATLDMSYVTAIGNGCHEQYPILIANRAFPAMSCFDGVSGSHGGDTLSGQDTPLDRMTCDHCLMKFNTKDSWIGPHTQVLHQTVTNSFAYGNMGAQWKWGEGVNGTVTFRNNLTVTNCLRMSEPIPGAVQNFNSATGLNGSYLSNFCRAGGAAFANVERAGDVNVYEGNTIVANGNIVFQSGCGYYTVGNVYNVETNCGPNSNVLRDNNFLGYTNPNPILGQASALYYPLNSDNSTSNNPSNTGVSYKGYYNNEVGFKGGTTDTCGSNNITCVNPQMTNQPAMPWPGNETAFDVFDPFGGAGNAFHPTSGSPLIGTGTTISGLTTDYYGTTRPSPPSMSGVELTGAAPPTLTSITPTPNPGTVQVSATLPMTCTAHYSDSTSGACVSPVWSGTNTHSSINTSGVVTGTSVGSDTITATIGSISGTAAVNVTAAPPPTVTSVVPTPNPGSVQVGLTLPMTCTAHYSDSSSGACVSPTWTNTNAHSTVNASGVVTGTSAGSDTITATVGTTSGTATVNVTAAPPPTVTSVVPTPNPGSVAVSAALPMVCTAHYSDSSSGACVSPTWSGTNLHSTINSAGVVTGTSAGSDTVTATVGTVSGTATVNVTGSTSGGGGQSIVVGGVQITPSSTVTVSAARVVNGHVSFNLTTTANTGDLATVYFKNNKLKYLSCSVVPNGELVAHGLAWSATTSYNTLAITASNAPLQPGETLNIHVDCWTS